MFRRIYGLPLHGQLISTADGVPYEFTVNYKLKLDTNTVIMSEPILQSMPGFPWIYQRSIRLHAKVCRKYAGA